MLKGSFLTTEGNIIRQQVNKSRTARYLRNKLEHDDQIKTGTDHRQGKLCFGERFECGFCNRYKSVLEHIEMFYAKKNHKLKLRNINSIIRSVPPHGVDYNVVKNKNEKSGMFLKNK